MSARCTLLIMLCFLGSAAPGYGSPLVGKSISDPSEVCDTAGATAARELNIPVNLLLAVTRIETGRRQNGELRPWPWTVNMEGQGKWFQTEDGARKYVFQEFKAGKRSFDVGCFQINYRWHGAAFRSIDDMFDPLTNARYAARFLQKLYDETGDWTEAVGAYHSRTPKHADRYTEKYKTVRAALGDTPGPGLINPPKTKSNNFPLLQSASVLGANGSLMPAGTDNGARALFAE